MRRLLASDLLPRRAGQPVKALVHISFADLCQLDADSALQEQWIAGYRARWAAHRAAASVSTGDGGAWLDGDTARAIACDAMIIPVVTGNIDPGAVDELIGLCVRYHALRTQPSAPGTGPAGPGTAAPDTQTPAHGGTPGPGIPDAADVPAGLADRTARQADLAATVTEALADLEHQIIAKILQVLSGPAGSPRSCAVSCSASHALMAAVCSQSPQSSGLVNGPPAAGTSAAAQRCAALSPTTRHARLATHLTALRAGQITLAQIP